jgi:hypothetical protein
MVLSKKPAAFLDLLVLADKYDCITAVYYFASAWMLNCFNNPSIELLIVAYLLDNPILSKPISQDLIINHPPIATFRVDVGFETHLPAGLWGLASFYS